jgi:chemotaxis protein CheD
MGETETTLPEVYLQPGESYLAREPTIIRTILGSCVGVTFWSERLGVGALCHAQLPKTPKKSPGGLTVAAGRRYVDFAIRDLARQFDELGVSRTETQIKLFGGGDVLLVSEAGTMKPTVGKMNCEVALQVLLDEGFEVTASSLGGHSGLNIRFNTSNGEVLLRRLN